MAKKPAKGAKGKSAPKRSKGAASSRAKRPPSVAAQLPAASPAQTAAAAKRYSRSVAARGEAVPGGTALPAGATHEVVDREADGTPVLKRRRFSTF